MYCSNEGKPETKTEVRHFLSNWLGIKEKKTDTAIIAYSLQKVNPTYRLEIISRLILK
jgi:hypothetical protein